MIQKDKEEAALRALQALILKGRAMAYENASHDSIANLLDGVEYLVALIYDPGDMTEKYIKYTLEVAEQFNVRSAIDFFDKP